MNTVRFGPLPMWMLLAIGVACGGDKSDSGTDAGYSPDIAGRYNVSVIGVAGCENEPAWLDSWARGPLDVSGAGNDLVFDFGENVMFGGRIESDGSFRFSGPLSVNGAELSVTGTGTAGIAPTDPGDGSQSALDGEISVVATVPNEPSCTIEGPFEATELVDFE